MAGTSSARHVMEYFYDLGERLTKIRSPSVRAGASRETIFQYDELDRVIRRILRKEEGGQFSVEDDTSFSFEPILDQELVTQANNQVVELGFTRLGAPPFSITGYTVTDPEGLGLIAGNFAVGRDVTGEISSVSDQNGMIFSKFYDPAGRLTQAQAGAFQVQLGYDGFGRKQSQVYGSGETGSFTYDLLNRILSVTWTGPTPVSQGLVYDEVGNIVQMTRENGSYSLAYDAIGQLISSSTTGALSYNRSFTYDLLGNRIQDSENGAGNHLNNFLLSNNASSFLADQDGYGEVAQETASSTKNYTYRADGKISGFQSGSLSVNYLYDGLDRLVAKQVNENGNGFTQSFLHLTDEFRMLQGKAGEGSITTYIDGQGLAERLGEVKGSAAKAYVTDHLGSVLNSPLAGAEKVYGLFGELAVNPAISSSSAPVSYGFTGHLVDLESGLNRTEYRQYQGSVGRWLTQEPNGDDGPNLYWYVANNPLKFYDQNGLSKNPLGPQRQEFQGGGGGGGGAIGWGGKVIIGTASVSAGLAFLRVCGADTYAYLRRQYEVFKSYLKREHGIDLKKDPGDAE